MQTTEQVVTRPFHETIVDAIHRCHPHPAESQIWFLFELIKETKIPKGHDEIIEAICQYFNTETARGWRDNSTIKETLVSLLVKQREALTKSDDKKKSVNLDEIQQEMEKLLPLLKDRQCGLMIFDELTQKRLQNLSELISQALGK